MLYELHTKPESLVHHDKLDTRHPETVWKKYGNNPIELKKRESALTKNAEYTLFLLLRQGYSQEALPSWRTSYSQEYTLFLLLRKGYS